MRRSRFRHVLGVIKEKTIDAARKTYAPIRKKNLNVIDFSIISNNCWGGKVYMRYGLPYATPTVGLYFFADDYIRFLKNLKYYMSLPMRTIPPGESKHYEILKARHQLNVPVGKIDDVEIVFLHYHSCEEAIEKWERRKKRINWERIIVKFSQMNCCEPEHLKEFECLDFRTKFVFVNTDKNTKNGISICVDAYRNEKDVADDTTHYADYVDVNKLINNNAVVPGKTPFSK